MGTRGLHDDTRGLECRGVLVCVQDREVGGLTQQHDSQRDTRSAGHDQEMRLGARAGDGHDAEVPAVPARRCRHTTAIEQVEIRYTLQRGPVDADIDYLAQRFPKGVGEVGKFSGYRRRAWPPGPVEAAAQVGRQGEPNRTAQAPSVYRVSHEPLAQPGPTRKPLELQGDRRVIPCDPWTVPSFRGRPRVHRPTYESDRTLIVLECVPNEDHRYYETVHLETTPRSLPA